MIFCLKNVIFLSWTQTIWPRVVFLRKRKACCGWKKKPFYFNCFRFVLKNPCRGLKKVMNICQLKKEMHKYEDKNLTEDIHIF